MTQLTAVADPASGNYDLTALGTADWLATGSLSGGVRNHKNVASLITFARIGGTGDNYFNAGGGTATWTDGTPLASGSDPGATHPGLNSNGSGYSYTVPAGVGVRTLRLIIGVYNGTIRITPTLSDGSATLASFTWTNSGTGDQRVVTITYAAASEGQTLNVTALMEAVQAGGAVHSVAAALSTPAVAVTVPGAPTSVTATAGNASASVTGTPPASNGGSPITEYTATAYPSGITGVSTTLPVNVSGLANGVAQTFTLKAKNAPAGYGPESAASAPATPTAVNNPPTFPGGSIANISGTAGTAITPVDVHALFADTDALTYSASPAGTAWPSWLSIHPTTGIITSTNGTVISAPTGLRVRATDTASQTVDSNAFNVTIAADASQIALGDTKVVWSPCNWDDRGTYKVSNTPGAYAKLAFTGVSIAAKVDVSALVAASVAAGSYPTVRSVVDGWNFVDHKLTSASTTISRTGLSNAAHTVEFYFLATDPSVARFGTDPVNAVRITGFSIDAAGTLTQAVARSKNMIYYADSIGEGWAVTGVGAPTGNNALLTAIPMIAQALNAEYGAIAYSGQGYGVAGGDVPGVLTAWDKFSTGRSRLVAGKFLPQPDYIFIEHGANDGTPAQADVQTMITNFRSAAPNARIFVQVPAGGFGRSTITAAVTAAADPKVNLLDLGVEYQAGIDKSMGNQQTMYAIDGLHRNTLSNARVAAGFIKQAQAAIDGATGAQVTPNALFLTASGRLTRSASGATPPGGRRLRVS